MVTGAVPANTPAPARSLGGRAAASHAGAAGIGYPGTLHGTDGDSCRVAAGVRSEPGTVRARGRRAADQITPEPPEERHPACPNPGWRADRPVCATWQVTLSRTGSRTNREGRTTGPGRPGRGQGGWYRGAAAGVPRPSGEAVLDGPDPEPTGTTTRGRPPTMPRADDSTSPPALPRSAVPRAARRGRPARDRARGAGRLAGRQGLRALAGPDGRRPPWTFYEGPPTANGMPGVHHIEARVFKDVVPAVQDHAGLSRARAGAAGTATGCRSRWPSRRNSA